MKEPDTWPTKDMGVPYKTHLANKKYLSEKYPGMTGEQTVAQRKKERGFLGWLFG